MDETQQLIGVIAALVTLLGTIATGLVYLLKRVSSIEIRVQRVGEEIQENTVRSMTTWEFMLRRGEIEAEEKGYLIPGPTPTLSPQAMDAFARLVGELQTYAHGEGKLLQRTPLAVEIERRWGPRIVHQVCRPLGVTQGACIVMALILCQQPTLQLDSPS